MEMVARQWRTHLESRLRNCIHGIQPLAAIATTSLSETPSAYLDLRCPPVYLRGALQRQERRHRLRTGPLPSGPTQSRITANCNEFYEIKSGSSCSAVESTFSITFAQLYAWNPAIGNNCQYLVIGDAICVSGPTTSSSTSSGTQVTRRGPTQSGIAANCNAYYLAQSGDSCSEIESRYGIAFTQLYTWNPAIGSNCQFLDVGDTYCVGVSS